MVSPLAASAMETIGVPQRSERGAGVVTIA